MPYRLGDPGSYGCDGHPVLVQRESGWTLAACHDTADEARAHLAALQINVEEAAVTTARFIPPAERATPPARRYPPAVGQFEERRYERDKVGKFAPEGKGAKSGGGGKKKAAKKAAATDGGGGKQKGGDEGVAEFLDWFSKLSKSEQRDFRKAFGQGPDDNGNPSVRQGAPKMNEDESPLKSPSSGKLNDFHDGLAVYDDGYHFDGWGWRDGQGRQTTDKAGPRGTDLEWDPKAGKQVLPKDWQKRRGK